MPTTPATRKPTRATTRTATTHKPGTAMTHKPAPPAPKTSVDYLEEALSGRRRSTPRPTMSCASLA